MGKDACSATGMPFCGQFTFRGAITMIQIPIICEECGEIIAKEDLCKWIRAFPNFRNANMHTECADNIDFVDGPEDWLEQEALALEFR